MSKILGVDSAYAAAKEMPYGSNMSISANLVIEMVEQIAELEKELTELKAYKAKLLAHVKYSSTQEEVEIIKLEQQAKGVYDVRATTGFWNLSTCSLRTHLREYEVILKNQAKALKEQDK